MLWVIGAGAVLNMLSFLDIVAFSYNEPPPLLALSITPRTTSGLRGSGGALHSCLWQSNQCSFWHSTVQYETCLQRAQRLVALRSQLALAHNVLVESIDLMQLW